MNNIQSQFQEEKEKSKLLIENFFKTVLGTEDVILFSVGNNTIRVFFNKDHNHQPSSIFKSWAYSFLKSNENSIKNTENFEKLHIESVDSLTKYWKVNGNKNPKSYLMIKLIDLFFKNISRWIELYDERRKWLQNHINSPVDQFTFLKLKEYYPNKKEYNKKRFSMKYVEQVGYSNVQKDIRDVVGANFPIEFDIVAWNNSHPFELKKSDKNAS